MLAESNDTNNFSQIEWLTNEAVARHKEGKVDEAIAFYIEVVELDRDRPAWVYGNLITLLAEADRFIKGLKVGEQALEIYPKSDEIHRAIGIIYGKQNNIENCINYYLEAIELKSNQPDWLYYNLAKNLLQNKDIDKSIEISQKGIDFHTNSYYLHYVLGNALEEQKQWDKAAESFVKALSIKPDLDEAQQKLDFLLNNCIQSDFKKSFDFYLQKIQHNSNDLESYRKALEIQSNQTSICLNVGNLLSNKGDFNRAITYYQRGLKIGLDCKESTVQFLTKTQANTKNNNSPESEFDHDFYIQYHQDLQFSSYEEAYEHWSNFGKKEDRLGSEEHFYQVYGLNKSDLPVDFDWQHYRELNPDLQSAINSKWQAISHFLRNGKVEGRLYSYNQLYYKPPQETEASEPLVDEIPEQNPKFDWQFYLDYNHDLNQFTNYEEAYNHWINNGQKEGRIGSVEDFYQSYGLKKSDIPADFDWQQYVALHLDLQTEINSKWKALGHYFSIGIKEGRIYSLKQLHERSQVAEKSTINSNLDGQFPEPKVQRVAVLCHMYYFDLWEEIRNYLNNINEEFDLYVNIVQSVWQPSIHDQLRQDFPNARIIISKNRGKDIGGQLASMGHIDFSQYDVFCLCHTKKSPHISQLISDQWRKDLYDAILGTPEKVKTNLEIMRKDPSVGLIGTRYWRNTEVLNNYKYYEQLLDEFEIKQEARDCEYLSGTMMLVRPQIMKVIYDKYGDIDLEDGDGKDLNFQKDGQIAHAIERIIGNLVRHQDMRFFWQD